MFKNLNFSSKIVVFMGVYLVIFSQEVLLLILLGKAEPSTLIISTFAAFGVEGGVLGWIKHIKLKHGVKHERDNINSNNYCTDSCCDSTSVTDEV